MAAEPQSPAERQGAFIARVHGQPRPDPLERGDAIRPRTLGGMQPALKHRGAHDPRRRPPAKERSPPSPGRARNRAGRRSDTTRDAVRSRSPVAWKRVWRATVAMPRQVGGQDTVGGNPRREVDEHCAPAGRATLPTAPTPRPTLNGSRRCAPSRSPPPTGQAARPRRWAPRRSLPTRQPIHTTSTVPMAPSSNGELQEIVVGVGIGHFAGGEGQRLITWIDVAVGAQPHPEQRKRRGASAELLRRLDQAAGRSPPARPGPAAARGRSRPRNPPPRPGAPRASSGSTGSGRARGGAGGGRAPRPES